MEMLSITSISYKDFISQVPSFISLDISKNSTGWSKWLNGELTQGTFHIPDTEDLVVQRRAFRNFIRELFGEDEFEYLFIEDIIGGVNFKTNRILYQLNAIPDDLIDEGVIKANNILREDNKVWKKHLRQASGYKSKVRSEKDDKQIVRECLFLLGFGDNTTNTIAEDIYDSIGLAIGIIYRKFVLKDKTNGRKLKTDVSKVYKIEQYEDEYFAIARANELEKELHREDFTGLKRDLKFNFKSMIESIEDDTKVFVITIPTNKIGAIALNKGLDLDMEISHLVIWR